VERVFGTSMGEGTGPVNSPEWAVVTQFEI
jgi:hypothetical protein